MCSTNVRNGRICKLFVFPLCDLIVCRRGYFTFIPVEFSSNKLSSIGKVFINVLCWLYNVNANENNNNNNNNSSNNEGKLKIKNRRK